MTAEEKAKDLMVKMDVIYYYKLGGKNSQSKGLPISMRHEQIKQCALIAVDEILELNVCWYDEDMVKDYPKSYKPDQTIEYWEQVKQELNKL